MPRSDYSDYSDVSWFFRALRVVPVIAGAALLGGMIGGFAVFAIDSALTWEPAPQAAGCARRQSGRHRRANNQAGQSGRRRHSRPIRWHVGTAAGVVTAAAAARSNAVRRRPTRQGKFHRSY